MTARQERGSRNAYPAMPLPRPQAQDRKGQRRRSRHNGQAGPTAGPVSAILKLTGCSQEASFRMKEIRKGDAFARWLDGLRDLRVGDKGTQAKDVELALRLARNLSEGRAWGER